VLPPTLSCAVRTFLQCDLSAQRTSGGLACFTRLIIGHVRTAIQLFTAKMPVTRLMTPALPFRKPEGSVNKLVI